MKPLVIQNRITKRDSEALVKYLDELNKIPLLTVDEEYEAAFIYQTEEDKNSPKAKKALDTLIKGNLRFVVSVAKQYETTTIKLVDLINEGNFGLIEAARRFDPSTNNKFISYAVHWIRRFIIQYLNNCSRSMRLPSNKVNIIRPMEEAVSGLEQELGRKLSDGEMVDVLSSLRKSNGDSYTEKDINFFLELSNTSYNMWSLDRPLSEDGGTVLDIYDGGSKSTDSIVTKEDNEFNVGSLIELLKDEKHKMVLKMYFGIGTGDALSLKEISEELDFSRERVRQIKDRALSILKSKSKELNLEYMYHK